MKTHPSKITCWTVDAIWKGSLTKADNGVTSRLMRVEARINP